MFPGAEALPRKPADRGSGESDGVLGWAERWAVCRPLRGTPSLGRRDPGPPEFRGLPLEKDYS